MIPRKKFRFGDRDASKSSAQLQLTAEDEQNLDAYVTKIKETVTILRKEMDAVKEGELEAVSNLFDEKSRVLKWLELRTPLVEPFLNHEFAQKLNIKGHLIELRKYIEEDGAMLSRMAIAARTVLREIEKINNRNTLGGVYGKSGQKISNATGGRINLDEEL
jgi:hypothetical protein